MFPSVFTAPLRDSLAPSCILKLSGPRLESGSETSFATEHLGGMQACWCGCLVLSLLYSDSDTAVKTGKRTCGLATSVSSEVPFG